jgi:UDP:flavonoid glycosyltransferase YjiC (YdhE family)
MPLAHDQPDNAQRLLRLGVSRTLMPKKFTGPNLAKALASLWSDPKTKPACAAVAERLKKEDAIGMACGVIESAASGV